MNTKLFLIQHFSIDDPKTGGKYTIKVYKRKFEIDDNDEEIKIIILKPLNSDYDPIILEPRDEDYKEQVKVIVEFVAVI